MNNQEKIKEALDRIQTGLAAINTDQDWLKYLQFQSLFYNYSFGNTMLIYVQNPEATYVKGLRAWNRLGRYVKKGEKGILIFAPCFRKTMEFENLEGKNVCRKKVGGKEEQRILIGYRTVYVYDIAQTDGDDSQLPVLVKGLAGNSEREKDVYEKLKAYISTKQPVEETEGTASKGSYSIITGIIRVRSDMDYAQKIKTLIHEYAHHLDFSLNPDGKISREERELTAESIAFIVSSRLGIDTSKYTISYLQAWLKGRDGLKGIADAVQKVASAIIDELAGALGPAFLDLREGDE